MEVQWGCRGVSPNQPKHSDVSLNLKLEILTMCRSLSMVLLKTTSSCSTTATMVRTISANLRREDERFDSSILKAADKILKILHISHPKKARAEQFEVISDSIACSLLFKAHSILLWLSTEHAWVLKFTDRPCPLTPSLQTVSKSLKIIHNEVDELENRSEVLARSSRRYLQWADLERKVTEVWEDFESPLCDKDSQEFSWSDDLSSSYLPSLHVNMASLRAIRSDVPKRKNTLAMITQFGIEEPDRGNRSFTFWIENHQSAKDWHDLKDVQTAAFTLGKDLSIYTTRFLFSIAHNQILLGWFKKWRLSLSVLVWQKQHFSPCVPLQKFIAVILHAENLVPEPEHRQLLRNPVTRREVKLLMGEQEKILREVELIILRTDICLSEPLLPRLATDSTGTVPSSVGLFIKQSALQLEKLIVEQDDMPLGTASSDYINELWSKL